MVHATKWSNTAIFLPASGIVPGVWIIAVVCGWYASEWCHRGKMDLSVSISIDSTLRNEEDFKVEEDEESVREVLLVVTKRVLVTIHPCKVVQ